MASKGPPPRQSAATDLGMLWTKAISDYKAKTGNDLSHMGAQSMSQVMQNAEGSLKKFGGFRHDDGKVDKVRSAFGQHLGDIQKCVEGFAMVGAAAGAFPPAMPVGLVFTACGRLLAAFAGVKADFDRVEQFFNYSRRFFERLAILEGRAESGPLAVAIVRVFSMQLSVCGIVECIMKEKRFKQWINALWNLEDQDLANAYAAMQASIEELGQAVGYESYSAIKDTQSDVLVVNVKVDELDEKIQAFRSSLGQDVQQLYASSLKLEVVVTEGIVAVRSKQDEYHAEIVQILKSMEKPKLNPGHEEKKKQGAKAGTKGDVGDGRFQAMRTIKAFFSDNSSVFPSWMDAHSENSAQEQELRESFVHNTAAWLDNDLNFSSWLSGSTPVLWIQGSEGVGKSFLAHSSVQRLRSQQDNKSLAYFYFKEEHPYLQSMENAFACAALQIAESNSKYAEQVAAKIKDDAGKPTEISTWKRFFLSMFPEGNKGNDHLFFVMDGLDEAHSQQKEVLVEFLTDIRKENARISILVTSRPEEKPALQLLKPAIIEITKEKITPAIRILVKSRLSTLPRVRKFSPAVKRMILRKLTKRADSMLYVEHMLRRFSYIGRERAVLKDLENMPASLRDLYKLLLEECRHDRSDEQYEAMKKLFAWLAFSKRPLSLAEASELVQLTLSDDTFDIEEEIIGRSSRILERTQTRQLDEDAKDEDKDDEDEDDQKDDKEPELEYQKSPVTFQDRSLRQYFRSVSVETVSGDEFRTPAPAAHLIIFQMCADIMMKAAAEREDNTKTSELSLYAVKYWYEHLKELDINNASHEVIHKVLDVLCRITSNTNNIARLFEEYTGHLDIYPERSPDSPTPWYDEVLLWAGRAASLPEDTLDAGVRDWAANVTLENALLTLAEGHVKNWLKSNEYWAGNEAFRFAKAALKLTGRFQPSEDEPLKEILCVKDTFEANGNGANAKRGVGVTLCGYAMEALDEERRKTMTTEAISYMKEATELMDGDAKDKSATWRVLSYMQVWIDDFPGAITSLDEALRLCPDCNDPSYSAQKKKESEEMKLDMMLDKARCLRDSKQQEASLDMYNKARATSGDDVLGGWALDDVTMIFENEYDPDGCKLMEVLKSWTDKERNAWFSYCFERWVDVTASDRMKRAAKLAGEQDLLLEWLTTLEKTLPPHSYYLFNLRGALAEFYYPILGNVEKGKAMRQTLLGMKPKIESWAEETVNEEKTKYRMQLGDIIFHEFRSSADPTRKEALVQEMTRLPNAHLDDDLRESHADMLLANMIRIMGPAKEYQKYMDQVFTTCVKGLEDSVSWNDSPSLRLLSKVLSSLDGLERDAWIAISAQFSMLDREIYDKESASETKSDVGENESKTEEEKAGVDEATKLESGEPVENGTVEKVPSTDTASSSQPDVEEETPSSTEDGSPETSTVEPGAPPPTTLTPPTNDDPADFQIFCDGRCGHEIKAWTEPFYYCLICPNTDLCEDCHSKRLAQSRGEIPEPWSSFCGKDHRYIRGPMKGWNGIKNGVIQIEGEEDLPVKEWLRGLKEEGWKNAWERYWLRQSGLKDIGVEA